MQIRVIFAAVAAVAILAGCAAGNDRLRNLNLQVVKRSLKAQKRSRHFS